MSVLITGGSEGIGYALAECFAKDGRDVILVARNKEKLLAAGNRLRHLYGIHPVCIAMDLSKEGAAKRLHEAVRKNHFSVDVLVNNAGIGYAGRSYEIDIEKEEALVRLNDIALMSLTKLFLSDFVKEGKGEIINIASTGAFQPGPYIASYYASKAFVLSYSEAVAQEVKGTQVRIYCYCPGPVDTAFYEKSGGRKTPGAISAEKAAAYLYRHRGKRVVIIPGIMNQLSMIVPKGLKMHVVKKMKERSL